MDKDREFVVYTGEKGVELFHKSMARVHLMNTFNMMHEWEEISDHDFNEINNMLRGGEQDQELAYSLIEIRVDEFNIQREGTFVREYRSQ